MTDASASKPVAWRWQIGPTTWTISTRHPGNDIESVQALYAHPPEASRLREDNSALFDTRNPNVLREKHAALAQQEACPNCHDTKRAIYFSEQGWKHEERVCHLCATQQEDGK